MQPFSFYSSRLTALAGVMLFFGLIWIYVLEFPVFTNTVDVRLLVLASMLAGAIAAGVLLYALRTRLRPWERHLPEVFIILVFSILFAPLSGSLLNRAAGKTQYKPFLFVSEHAYVSAPYGLLAGEKTGISGYRLRVESAGRSYFFQYKKQRYFPLTKPGETVLLPMRRGWLGFRVLELQ